MRVATAKFVPEVLALVDEGVAADGAEFVALGKVADGDGGFLIHCGIEEMRDCGIA